MSALATAEWLTTAIAEARKSAHFCVIGVLPMSDPGLELEQLGAMKFPLSKKSAKELVARCQLAPYGKGTQTLVNPKVRKTCELDPGRFRLSEEWSGAISAATQTVAAQLGLPAEQLEAQLYKLLVYEKGGFFLPHRDSEKHDRMVASLIVVLPNRFEGGELLVRHGAGKQTFSFGDAAIGKSPCYAAFYADCEHEVRRVTSGVRVCLAYNLVLKPERQRRKAKAPPAAPDDELAQSLAAWIASQPAKPLVFALEHHYTQRGLSLDLLKGGDRQLAELVVAAAAKADGLVHLAQVSRHLLQFADDGSIARSYSRSYRATQRAIEIGETYEDDLCGSEWTDLAGKRQPWGEIAFDHSAIVSPEPLDAWKPTSEEFEGYTGNAGNTLDRWYRRSAIVVWPRDQHFSVIASSGAANCIPFFDSLVGKLARTPRKRLEQARADCVRFARAIIARWPNRGDGFLIYAGDGKSPCDEFPDQLQELHDQDTIAMFLAKVAQHDQALRLRPLVMAACREFGWSAFVPELKQLLTARTRRTGRQDLLPRDVEWLAAYCDRETTDPEKAAHGRALCKLAADRFCEPFPPRPAYDSPHYRREPSPAEQSLLPLLKAILVGGSGEDLLRVIRFVRESPAEFNLDDCQVPCLVSIVPWSRKRLGHVHDELAKWLEAVRRQLADATAKNPEPPIDWGRPAELTCKCKFCAQLNAFLSDPASDAARIRAPEGARAHLIDAIARHALDVKHALERRGNPYSLVLTKTAGSFERAVKRFEMDRQLLDSLPADE
jgi:hypothetical protein